MATKASARNTSLPENQPETSPATDLPRYIAEKDLLVWNAPSRPFKKRSRDYWVVIMSVAGLLAFILFLAEGVMPVVMIISIVFLYYVLATVPPHEITYKITNLGIKIEEVRTDWDFLTRYWFEEKLGSTLLVVESVNFPGRVELVANEKDMAKIREIMTKYLPEDKPKETAVDKATSWVANKLLQS